MSCRHDHHPDSLYAGLRALGRHDAPQALPLLRKAVAECPATRPAELSRRLYWLAIALRRLDKQPLAVKALAEARALVRRGQASRYYRNTTNAYGQPRSACADHDDYRAFFSIQVRRYLQSVPGQRFDDQAEQEALMEFLARTWLALGRSGELAGLDCSQKLDWFRRYTPAFPVLRQRTVRQCRLVAFPSCQGRDVAEKPADRVLFPGE